MDGDFFGHLHCQWWLFCIKKKPGQNQALMEDHRSVCLGHLDFRNWRGFRAESLESLLSWGKTLVSYHGKFVKKTPDFPEMRVINIWLIYGYPRLTIYSGFTHNLTLEPQKKTDDILMAKRWSCQKFRARAGELEQSTPLFCCFNCAFHEPLKVVLIPRVLFVGPLVYQL